MTGQGFKLIEEQTDKLYQDKYGRRDMYISNTMKFFAMAGLMLALVWGFVGCASYEEYKSLPSDQKAQYLKDQAVEWLQNNKENVRTGLVIAGTKAMQYAVNDIEREQIANEMWAASVAFKSLATGQIVTPEQLRSTLNQFGEGNASARYKDYVSEVTMIWGGFFNNLKLSSNQQLAVDYLLILADAAETVAANWKNPVQTYLDCHPFKDQGIMNVGMNFFPVDGFNRRNNFL